MNIVEGLKYSKEHEWVRIEGDTAYIGITDYAQHSLGEIVYVELPEEGAQLSAGDVLSAIDSVKAASDVYAPVSGSVIKVNEALSDAPESINSDPYGSWIAAVKMDDPGEADALLDAKAYEEFCASEE
ncbi:MAG: glycine cleavage system protein GcvH [Burkholderiales bacterium]